MKSQITNYKLQTNSNDRNSNNQNRHSGFRIWGLEFGAYNFKKRGIILLLVMIILSAILSVSIGIFNVIFGGLLISGETSDSSIAFYAADQGIEKMLYRDRVLNEICPTPGENCFPAQTFNVQSGGCYTIRVSKTGGTTTIVVSGQYRCGANPTRVVKRGFQVTY